MYFHFVVMGIAASGMLIGLWYRFSAILFFLCFTYYFLLEQAAHLNHYYLVVPEKPSMAGTQLSPLATRFSAAFKWSSVCA